MSEVFRPTYTDPVPKGAKIITKPVLKNRKPVLGPDGEAVTEKVAQWADRTGRLRTAPVILTDGGLRIVREVRSYYGRLRHADGRVERVELCRSEDSARMMLTRLQAEADREAAEGPDPRRQHRKRPLTELLDEYRQVLEHDEDTADHVRTQIQRCRSILEGCGFRQVSDLEPDRIKGWLADRRANRNRFSLASSNHYIVAVKGFSAWLGRKAGVDPLADMEKLPAAADLRRERRAASVAEMAAVVRACLAPGAEVVEGDGWRLDGLDRVLLYLTALATGFRADELAALKPESFRLLKDRAEVTAEAVTTKNGQKAVQPLPPGLAKLMARHLKLRPKAADVALWPGRWNARAAHMLRADLRAASAVLKAPDGGSEGIPWRTVEGVLDFHALRVTGITWHYFATKDPKRTQIWARHSNIDLTMETYMSCKHLTDADTMAALLAEVGPEVEARLSGMAPPPPSGDGGEGEAPREEANGQAGDKPEAETAVLQGISAGTDGLKIHVSPVQLRPYPSTTVDDKRRQILQIAGFGVGRFRGRPLFTYRQTSTYPDRK